MIETPLIDGIKSRIVRILEVYPKISPSMLQIALGTGVLASTWRPILDEMIEAKTVKKTYVQVDDVGGRSRSYTVISLFNTNTGN
jgi:hypothetical protein